MPLSVTLCEPLINLETCPLYGELYAIARPLVKFLFNSAISLTSFENLESYAYVTYEPGRTRDLKFAVPWRSKGGFLVGYPIPEKSPSPKIPLYKSLFTGIKIPRFENILKPRHKNPQLPE